MKYKQILLSIMLIGAVILGCSKKGEDGENGIDGNNSLLELKDEPSGEHCSSGGFKIISGIDLNANGLLDDNEIQNTEYICNGDDGGYDKVTLINFPANGYANGNNTTQFEIIEMQIIRDFNISNYLNTDSITFGVYLRSENPDSECIIELYDLSNNNPINNTTLTSSSTSWEWKSTRINFLHDLPKTTFDLGIRIKSEEEENAVSSYLPAIVIYRQ